MQQLSQLQIVSAMILNEKGFMDPCRPNCPSVMDKCAQFDVKNEERPGPPFVGQRRRERGKSVPYT